MIQGECNAKEIYKSVVFFLNNPMLMERQVKDCQITLEEIRSKTSSAGEASSILAKYLTLNLLIVSSLPSDTIIS